MEIAFASMILVVFVVAFAVKAALYAGNDAQQGG
jgi:hypothetical protein